MSGMSVAGAEAAVKVCGVAVAVLPGYSWAPTWLIGYVVNVGTAVAALSPGHPAWVMGRPAAGCWSPGGTEAP